MIVDPRVRPAALAVMADGRRRTMREIVEAIRAEHPGLLSEEPQASWEVGASGHGLRVVLDDNGDELLIDGRFVLYEAR